jgi:dolichyl-phosphate beta-glucosyltransferase
MINNGLLTNNEIIAFFIKIKIRIIGPVVVGFMLKTIIVIPCYNEAERLKDAEFNLLLQKPDLQLLFVNDGSKDNTEQRLEEMIRKIGNNASIINLKINRGKAEAVRCGMLQAIRQGAIITGFIDADMATPAKEVLRLLNEAIKKEAAVTLGSRVRLLGTMISRRPVRHYIGRLFSKCASIILRLPVYDTQCGAKLFYVSPSLKDALLKPFNSRWIFDVELIGRLLIGSETSKPLTAQDFVEIPLNEWMDVKGSKITFADFIKAASDLMKIAVYLSVSRNKIKNEFIE